MEDVFVKSSVPSKSKIATLLEGSRSGSLRYTRPGFWTAHPGANDFFGFFGAASLAGAALAARLGAFAFLGCGKAHGLSHIEI